MILPSGRTQFARVRGWALITDDGEAIEGAVAKEVEIMGLMTFFINSASEDDKGDDGPWGINGAYNDARDHVNLGGRCFFRRQSADV